MKKKGLIIGLASGGAVLAVAIVLICVFALGNKEEAYRVIKVLAAKGHSYVSREEIGELESYEGMALQSGDTVRVDGNSTMTLIVDEDKVCYVEENTQFKLVAEGTSVSSKTLVELDYGTMTWDVQNKLSSDSSFEIQTPNSTMAIRGTVPLVSVVKDPNNAYPVRTKFTILEGEVDIKYFDSKGIEIGNLKLSGGSQLEIGSNDQKTEIISQSNSIDMSEFGKSTLEALEEILEERSEKEMGYFKVGIEDSLEKIKTADSYNVIFMDSNDREKSNIFATQVVPNGSKLQKPKLQPTAEGKWDVDFDLEVSDDLVVYWIPEN